MTKTIHYLSILAIATILIGSISVGTVAFADDDDDEDDDDNKKSKTFESECAKKLKKKNLNLDGLFCQAIITIQEQLASLSLIQTNLDEPVLKLMVDPDSQAPAMIVENEDEEALFTVKKDGSIQIGFNTVTISPDGTINAGGDPLIVQQSPSQTSNLQEWQDSTGTILASVSSSGVISGAGSTLASFGLGNPYGPFTVDAGESQTADGQIKNATAVECTYDLQTIQNGWLLVDPLDLISWSSTPDAQITEPTPFTVLSNEELTPTVKVAFDSRPALITEVTQLSGSLQLELFIFSPFRSASDTVTLTCNVP